jgi:hypothetical protein
MDSFPGFFIDETHIFENLPDDRCRERYQEERIREMFKTTILSLLDPRPTDGVVRGLSLAEYAGSPRIRLRRGIEIETATRPGKTGQTGCALVSERDSRASPSRFVPCSFHDDHLRDHACGQIQIDQIHSRSSADGACRKCDLSKGAAYLRI